MPDEPQGRDGSSDPARGAQPGTGAGADLARTALATARAAARRRGRSTPNARPVRAGTPPSGSRDPELVGVALEALVHERGWQRPVAAGGALERWPDIVGAEIAEHTEPAAYLEGVLTVRTSSTAWATQLRLLAPEIVRRLNTELGHGTVTRLDIRGPAGPSWQRGRFRVQGGRGPRDTYG